MEKTGNEELDDFIELGIPIVPDILSDGIDERADYGLFHHYRGKDPGSQLMDKGEFASLCGPGVYIFWGKENHALYIGSTPI